MTTGCLDRAIAYSKEVAAEKRRLDFHARRLVAFAALNGWLKREGKHLSRTEYAVAAQLIRLLPYDHKAAKVGAFCEPRVASMAAKLRTSERTVKRATLALVEAGLFVKRPIPGRKRTRGRSCYAYFVAPYGVQKAEELADKMGFPAPKEIVSTPLFASPDGATDGDMVSPVLGNVVPTFIEDGSGDPCTQESVAAPVDGVGDDNAKANTAEPVADEAPGYPGGSEDRDQRTQVSDPRPSTALLDLLGITEEGGAFLPHHLDHRLDGLLVDPGGTKASDSAREDDFLDQLGRGRDRRGVGIAGHDGNQASLSPDSNGAWHGEGSAAFQFLDPLTDELLISQVVEAAERNHVHTYATRKGATHERSSNCLGSIRQHHSGGATRRVLFGTLWALCRLAEPVRRPSNACGRERNRDRCQGGGAPLAHCCSFGLRYRQRAYRFGPSFVCPRCSFQRERPVRRHVEGSISGPLPVRAGGNSSPDTSLAGGR